MANDKSKRRIRRRKFNVKDQQSRCLNISSDLQNFDLELDLLFINSRNYYNTKTHYYTNEEYITETDLRVDKPGRLCVASSADGNWFVFIDTITNKNYSTFNCFLWNQPSKIKVQLPCLPDKPEHFLKCIVGTDRSHPRVFFFYKNEPRYICCLAGSKDWHLCNSHMIYCDVVSWESLCANGDISDTYCGVSGTSRFLSISIFKMRLHSPNESSLYQRRLVVDYYGEPPRKDLHCRRLFLLERRAHTFLWEIWEVDVSCGKLVRVDNLAGKAIFLSGNYTAVCKSGLVGNCICFTLDGDNDNFYVFRLADKTTSIFPNQPHSGFPVWFPNLSDPGLRWLSLVEKDVEKNVIPEEEPEEKVAEIMPLYPQESVLLNLPDDIQRLLAESLCSTMDYANLRMVCRKWRDIARPINWRHHVSNMESPWLMSFEDKNACASFLDPTCNMRFYSIIEELSGSKIWYSKDGWLLVTRFPQVFFFEPFSKKKISVPDLPSDFNVDWMSFSSQPTSSDWIIIATLASWTSIEVTHIKSGEKNWSYAIPIAANDGTCITPVCAPVFHNDRVCCLAQNRSLTVLRLSGTEIEVDRILSIDESFNDKSPQYLVPCEENLYLVVMGQFGKYVDVYVLDAAAQKWEKVNHDVDNFSFFISQTSSFAIRTTKNGDINFPLFVENNHLSYKLDRSDFRCHRANMKQTEMNERKELSCGTWIQPKVIRGYR